MYVSRWGELLIGSLKSKGEATWPCPSCNKAQKCEVPIDYMSFSFLQIALDHGVVLFPNNGCVFLKCLLFLFDQMK